MVMKNSNSNPQTIRIKGKTIKTRDCYKYQTKTQKKFIRTQRSLYDYGGRFKCGTLELNWLVLTKFSCQI